MTHTAEEVRANVAENCRHMTTATEAQLTAYAALLERREAGVTDEVVNAAFDAFFDDYRRHPRGLWKDFLRAALTAVWPIAAEPAQPTDSGRVAKALRGLLEIGKRDLTNPKYDGFWNEARAALAAQTTGVRDEIAEEAWRSFYRVADKVQKESQSNG